MSSTENFPTDDPTWEFDSIFAGGPASEEFENFVGETEELLDELKERVSGLAHLGEVEALGDDEAASWVEFVGDVERAADRMREAGAFAGGMSSAHTDNPRALRLPSRLNSPRSVLESLLVDVRARLRGVDDEVFATFVDDPEFADVALFLRELRRDADLGMEPKLESLAVDLNRDGLHAWGQLYYRVSSQLKVTVPAEDGEGTEEVSVGQAYNRLDHPDRAQRKAAFEGLQEAWSSEGSTFAMILNSIIGTERTLYARRGIDELTVPLNANRVSRETVEAMFAAADSFRDQMVSYMRTKARLLGRDKLDWFDLMAPVGSAESKKIDYCDAQEFIVEQIDEFSGRMGEFYRHALANQWVEVEDRSGKGQGGYCTGLPVSGQTRIFMTFGGSPSGVSTLAHELGHAYHGWLMRDLSAFGRKLPMGLAETASTLAEALVESAALERAEGQAKLRLLDEQLQRTVAFLVNIPARFRLELAMHELREAGQLDEEMLTEKTVEIFEDAYGDGVSSVDPMYWASKLHFFLTNQPFYNFPYTFGYLFSRAVYQRSVEAGDAGIVDDLLMDTGRLTAEQIGEKYLDADLSSVDFWKGVIDPIAEDVALFEEMAGE